MRSRARRTLLLAGTIAAGACGAAPQPPASDGSPAAAAAARYAWTPAASERLPPRFGLGRSPTSQEITRLDIDVDAGGRGLPPGAGTARQGAVVYAARCAACHGTDGEGTPAGSRLVADDPHAFISGEDYEAFFKRTIGNYWPYAPTVFDYVRRAMPMDRPGSLSDDEVYAVVAWLLWRNDIIAADEPMDAASLPRVRMPARDRFVPDDRESSNRVR